MIAWVALALALLNTLCLLGFAVGVGVSLRKAAPYLQMFSALGQVQKTRPASTANEPLPPA